MTYYIHYFLRQLVIKSGNSKIAASKNHSDGMEEFVTNVRINSRILR